MIFLDEMCRALRSVNVDFSNENVRFQNANVSSKDVYDVVDLASASISTAILALGRYAHGSIFSNRQIITDKRLAYLWFRRSVRPIGWQMASVWDDLAGDYQTRDGWIRLHTNAPLHRNVIVNMFGSLCRSDIAKQVKLWDGAELEETAISHGGVVAKFMRADEWAHHPQGLAIAGEPLINQQLFEGGDLRLRANVHRPLEGLKVLDLTRILAGPVATRFLSGFGANVLRIDPPDWDEGDHVIDITPGKKCATLDLRRGDDLAQLKRLISEADVMVHGLRGDALERLGLSDQERRALNPSLIDISLNAYGWTGPWRNRRGFDSLVQMSTGIAAHGMHVAISDRPRPMSVQALDHATGYLMAAAVLTGLTHLRQTGRASTVKLSLAATAELLKKTKRGEFGALSPTASDEDFRPDVETTSLGHIQRLKPPFWAEGLEMRWATPATTLHSSTPMF